MPKGDPITTLLSILFVLLIFGYMIVGVENQIRVQKLGPLCTSENLVLIDSDMWQSAKCWNPATGLMTVPIPLMNKR